MSKVRKTKLGLVISTDEVMPASLINAIKALDNRIRRDIIFFLMDNGKKSFTEIYKGIDISKQKANNHLQLLNQAGLVKQTIKKVTEGENSNFSSYYKHTKLTENLINCLFLAINPERYKKVLDLLEACEFEEDIPLSTQVS